MSRVLVALADRRSGRQGPPDRRSGRQGPASDPNRDGCGPKAVLLVVLLLVLLAGVLT